MGRIQRGARLPELALNNQLATADLFGAAGAVGHGHRPVLPRGAGRAAGHPLAPWPTSTTRQQVVYCASPADVGDVWWTATAGSPTGALVGHDLAALVEADRPLAAEPVTRAGLAELSRLAVSDGGLSGMAGRRRPGRGGPPG
jgi:hypothetical protein